MTTQVTTDNTIQPFIIKLFAHIKPSLFIVTATCHTHLKLLRSSDFSAQSESGLTNVSASKLNSSLTLSQQQQMSHSPCSSVDSPELSGDEVGLGDDAFHFVICWVCCCLVVTDRHFMSVSLKRTKTLVNSNGL